MAPGFAPGAMSCSRTRRRAVDVNSLYLSALIVVNSALPHSSNVAHRRQSHCNQIGAPVFDAGGTRRGAESLTQKVMEVPHETVRYHGRVCGAARVAGARAKLRAIPGLRARLSGLRLPGRALSVLWLRRPRRPRLQCLRPPGTLVRLAQRRL